MSYRATGQSAMTPLSLDNGEEHALRADEPLDCGREQVGNQVRTQDWDTFESTKIRTERSSDGYQ